MSVSPDYQCDVPFLTCGGTEQLGGPPRVISLAHKTDTEPATEVREARLRLLLATTLLPVYGIYSGYELSENVPVKPGSEEYMNSEKYQLRQRNFAAPGNLDEDIRLLNGLRRTHWALQQYAKRLDSEYGQYFKVGRLFARVVGRPTVMRELTRIGLHNRTLMEWVLRIMANELRHDETGPAEIAYGTASAIARLAPNA